VSVGGRKYPNTWTSYERPHYEVGHTEPVHNHVYANVNYEQTAL